MSNLVKDRFGNAIYTRTPAPDATNSSSSSPLNESDTRRAGLPKGGRASEKNPAPAASHSTPQSRRIGVDKDWRVRISAPPKSQYSFEKDYKGNGFTFENILRSLNNSHGVVFPYTPSISVAHQANYQAISPTHSNYPSYFYSGSSVGAITITADFTAQTDDQAKYVLAAIYFFRAATKMFYNGPNSGNPPPVLYLDGYGSHYFPHVPVVVSDFTHSMPSDVDYIPCNLTRSKEVIVEATTPTAAQPPGPAPGFNGRLINPGTNVVGTGQGAGTAALEAVRPTTGPSPNVGATAPVPQGRGLGLVTPSLLQQSQQQAANNSAATAKAVQARQPNPVIVEGMKQWIPTVSTMVITVLPVYSRRNIAGNFSWEEFAHGILLKDKGGFL